MAIHTWWLFVGAVFLVSGTPGPNMLHIMTRSVDMGLRRSVAAMAGCLSAVVIVLAASAAGLTTLLLALPGAFEVIRYAGVAYLLFLGVKAWRANVAPVDVGDAPIVPSLSRLAVFRGGFLIGISNPKLILFAVAFLPQFINPARAQVPQFAILVATFAVIEAFWYVVYAFGGRSLSRYMSRPMVKRAFNRVTGVIFMGFGLALLKAKPA
ncbi:LysE family translocator [Sphingomonas sp. SORGH_AS_0879]|uniref:LysE family translocator n=1 Tax=Sphingomonas sp. SORGH_AS_0879 TaxID=3041790 RepID=UPI002788BE6F|nr:LysE family translocator [Sphingomonas sp. SORGH_AS_0879]MDQ1229620.1 threonine/homoserine/homoserine lactone efflux protein [Sphingomonas sp. SORGH_AS_0879]